MSARLAPLRSVAVSVLIASALALCLLANSQHGAPEQHASAQLRVGLAVRAQRMGRTKQLESEASREAALAHLEAKVCPSLLPCTLAKIVLCNIVLCFALLPPPLLRYMNELRWICVCAADMTWCVGIDACICVWAWLRG